MAAVLFKGIEFKHSLANEAATVGVATLLSVSILQERPRDTYLKEQSPSEPWTTRSPKHKLQQFQLE